MARRIKKSGDNLEQQREIKYYKNGQILIVKDLITGTKHHRMISNLHIHPSFVLKENKNDNKIMFTNNYFDFEIITNNNKIKLNKGYYCARFGIKEENYHIKMISNELPSELVYKIKPLN